MELPSKYPPEHYHQKAHNYARALRYGFGVEVDNTTQERWSDLIALGRGIDTYLDEGNRDTLIDRTQDIEQFLDQPESVAYRFPSLDPKQLGEETYAKLRRFAGGILHTNLHFKTTESATEYIQYRKLEGRLYATLISCVATPTVATQPGYERFRRWLVPVGEITNLINSLHGIRSDYKKGEIVLTPSSLTYLRLIGHTALSLARAPQTASTKPVLLSNQLYE